MPDRVHGCRADTVAGEDMVEVLEVAGFLVVHVFHQRPEVRIGLVDRWGLGCIDESGGQLSGVVDTESGVEKAFLFRG